VPGEFTDKSIMRAQGRAALRALTPEERAAGSQKLCALARELSVFQQARTVLFFSALADEPDLRPLLEESWQRAKVTALPRFDATSGQYQAAVVRTAADLVAGRYGVLEPAANCPAVSLNQLDLVFVPGVAFDFAGGRLGRGKGFYDRLLAEVCGHKCGVAYETQVIANVPVEPHDVRLNSLLTPAGWRPCRPAD
jgi:5-formyltetrahydrofolate cyclo-ligase